MENNSALRIVRTYDAVLEEMGPAHVDEGHGFSRIDSIAAVKMPAALFLRMGGKATPDEVNQTCDACGAHVKPLIVKNGFLPGECPCKREAREHAAREAIRKELYERELNRRRADCARCYTWLDENEVGLEEYSFDTFQQDRQPDAYAKLLAFVSRRDEDGKPVIRGNYLLLGDYGTGKTMLASAVCNTLTRLMVPCRFMTAQGFFEALYASYNRKGKDSEPSVLTEASETPVLVIDDLDKLHLRKNEDGECFQHKMLFEVLDKRYKRGLSTIITTNSDEITRYIGGASFSRLKRGLVLVPMYGDDFRDTMIDGLK